MSTGWVRSCIRPIVASDGRWPAFIAISTGIAEHTLDGTTRPTPEQLDLFDAPSLPKPA